MRLDSQSSDYLSLLAVEGKRASATHTQTLPSGLILIEPTLFFFISFDNKLAKLFIDNKSNNGWRNPGETVLGAFCSFGRDPIYRKLTSKKRRKSLGEVLHHCQRNNQISDKTTSSKINGLHEQRLAKFTTIAKVAECDHCIIHVTFFKLEEKEMTHFV